MNKNQQRPSQAPGWVYWFAERGFAAIVAIGVGAVLAVSIAAYFFDRRLENLEDRIQHKPPRSYTPPDLSEYAAPPISDEKVVRSQTVYVPVYSHVYYDGGRPLLLEATVSIRNTSSSDQVYIRSVRYFDTDGALIDQYVDQPIMLKPLQTIDFVVPKRDSSGGSGANFLVDWFATEQNVEPLIEVVMMGNSGSFATSVLTEGKNVP